MINIHPIIKQDIEEIIDENRSGLKKLAGKNILVTGAAGMLTSYLVYTFLEANRSLLKKKTTLYLVIRNKTRPFGRDRNIHYIRTDISKKPLPVQHVRRAHYILHAASKSAPKFYISSPVDTINANIRGLYHLLDICDGHLKSFLFLSSGAVYGESVPDKPIREDFVGRADHLNPRSSYVMGKRACETILMSYYREKKFPVKIARIFHTFGPGLNLDDGRVFSDFIKQALGGKKIAIRGGANIKRPFLYIRDATSMFIKLLLSEKNGEVYNVASNKNILSVEQFANRVASVVNNTLGKKITVVKKKSSRPYYKHVAKSYVADISKFKRDFGYEPKTDIATALERTIEYLDTRNG